MKDTHDQDVMFGDDIEDQAASETAMNRLAADFRELRMIEVAADADSGKFRYEVERLLQSGSIAERNSVSGLAEEIVDLMAKVSLCCGAEPNERRRWL